MNGTIVQDGLVQEGATDGRVAAYAERLAVHYSSARQDWRTPRALFDVLDAEFRFTTDAAASGENALCAPFPSAVVIFDGVERPERTPVVRWWDWKLEAARRAQVTA